MKHKSYGAIGVENNPGEFRDEQQKELVHEFLIRIGWKQQPDGKWFKAGVFDRVKPTHKPATMIKTPSKVDLTLKNQINRMHKQGMDSKYISNVLGVGISSINQIINGV